MPKKFNLENIDLINIIEGDNYTIAMSNYITWKNVYQGLGEFIVHNISTCVSNNKFYITIHYSLSA